MADLEAVAIRECPGRVRIDTEENWYHFLAAPSLDICSRCYVDFLQNLPFAGIEKVVHQYDPSGTFRNCDFSAPRMKAVLREALDKNDFSVLENYVARRGQLPRCKGGGELVAAHENFSWFQPPEAAGQFGACSACYEDYVVPSNYASHFADTPIKQRAGEYFTCPMAWQFCCHSIANGQANWDQIMAGLLYRRQLPKCAGFKEVNCTSRKWYRPLDPVLGSIWACEACYYDQIYHSKVVQHFVPLHVEAPPFLDNTCFLMGNVPLSLAFDETILRGDWRIFQRAAQIFARNPRCHKNGVQSSLWYSLIPAADDFDVCQSCYACVFEARGVGHFLAPKAQAVGSQVRRCNMNITSPHALSMYRKLGQAIDRNDVSIFSTFTRRISGIPSCPREHPVRGRRWFCHDMFTCCPACWIEAPIRGTRLSSCLSEKDIAEPLKCDFYSTRIRNLWSVACKEDDLAGFATFMEKRLEIWKQTYALIQINQQTMVNNVLQQQSLFLASTINTAANGIAAASGINGHWGNAQLGHNYATAAGAEGAAQFNQALSMNPTALPSMNIIPLKALWKMVE